MLLDHVKDRLLTEPVIWFTVTRPRSAPVWFLWDDWTVWTFTTAETHRRADVARDAAVALNLETADDGKDVVLLDGRAAVVPGVRADQLDGFVAKYRERTGGEMTSWADTFSVAIRVDVARITAWTSSDGGVFVRDRR